MNRTKSKVDAKSKKKKKKKSKQEDEQNKTMVLDVLELSAAPTHAGLALEHTGNALSTTAAPKALKVTTYFGGFVLRILRAKQKETIDKLGNQLV